MVQQIPAVSKTQPPNIKTHYNVVKLLVIGLAFHLIYIGSVFDCYFTSPVIHGMRSYGRNEEAPAKRLVLIVGDGLRADLLFNANAFPSILDAPEVVAPHLRSIAETRGAFGISHTRVPTESRPGHVAIIGGMYEDVSAVTKGWKTNPVDFDSVFNQSSSTFSFGSPDILPMFARGATLGKVKTWSYDEDEEDFTKDATALDIWVLDQLKVLLSNATTNQPLMNELRSDKVVFFLHLLGLDTTGHSYRPHSKEYMENIRVVDTIVRETEQLIDSFYGDSRTSFIFTADHGMSAIGNHGDGHPDSTRTPLIAWGSGIRGPMPDSTPSSHDTYSEPWRLGRLYRRDVEQADIAPLMASLIGIDWPVNSVGVLPDVDPTRPGYLDTRTEKGDEVRGQAVLANAKVILEQYRLKHELKKRHTLFYKPFKPLTDISMTETAPPILKIAHFNAQGNWSAARQASFELIQQALTGLHYLQTYDRFLIRGFVTAAYLGWAAYASLYILRPLDKVPSALSTSALISSVTATSWMVLVAFWILFAIQKSPWSFYVYIAFPCYFWREFLVQIVPAVNYYYLQAGNSGHPYAHAVLSGIMVVGSLLGMVLGYTHRSIWSIGFLLIGAIWPLTWNKGLISNNLTTAMFWTLSCMITAIFPLLSVDKSESLLTITLGGAIILLSGASAAYYVLKTEKHLQKCRILFKLFFLQGILIALTMLITSSSVKSLQDKKGLPLPNQVAGWVVLVSASALPFLSPVKTHTKWSKILMYYLGFGPCFVILSISVEGFFFVAYSATLAAWIQVEAVVRHNHIPDCSLQPSSPRSPTAAKRDLSQALAYTFQLDDLRIALFFLFFVQVGFFGTGNVASISSFYLAPVYRLIPIFSPFYMATLLLFKIIAPYIILAVSFAVLNDALRLPPFSLLLVALTLTDGMTLAFFFQVQDTGSWLEIGQSITFFCIASLLLLWSAGISAAGEFLMSDVITPHRFASSQKTE
ncbi:hypothetical protein NLJ89_g404 [Agrocybe chaxingu]|uniref:GPI ethanolamine phosphate transferase 1 n=1 Tax=Agrocybe chaxingu TaxID=84603 RepID=A0A9W8N245_9AGAR|nr:hypothetical protein NLJ89_g404 [Agrocybe chaxingu]